MLKGLIEPEVSLSVYVGAMQALASAYAKLDDLFQQRENFCPDGVPAYTPRIPGIRRDLITLHALDHCTQTSLPVSCLPEPYSEASYLGIRYVVEGAQLGSRVIHRHLLSAFGEKFNEFGSFWAPDSAMQNSWAAVLQALSGLHSRKSLAEVATAARQTFRHMELHLTVPASGGS